MSFDQKYMDRALQLAKKATKKIKTNPAVGAVLVYQDKVIGEGYHQVYGEAHAEVNCILSVLEKNKKLISESTIYVTLEPCHHTGKTPPCVDLIIKHNIQRVVIGTLDPNPKVGGQSIEKLKSKNIAVTVGICEEACQEIIKPFLKSLHHQLPWVILKLAKSKYNFMAPPSGEVWFSNHLTKIKTHQLRADVDGILIGTNTALIDNPSLTTRYIQGAHPTRIVLDRTGKLPLELNIFQDGHKTIYVTSKKRNLGTNVTEILIDFTNENHLINIFSELYKMGIYRLLIEGGPTLMKTIVQQNLWDEAIVISTEHPLSEGIKAPNINGKLVSTLHMNSDMIHNILSV